MSAPALFGGRLYADLAPMRLIYVDEAGTSAKEPVSIVVGLLINPDTQWVPAYERFSAALAKVPEKFQEGFIFHATSIWGNPKYRDGWERKDRFDFLKEVMRIPAATSIPIAIGAVGRQYEIADENVLKFATQAQAQHAFAFGLCISAADGFIRTVGDETETGIVVAEDIPEMRRFIRDSVTVFNKVPLEVDPKDYIQRPGTGPRLEGMQLRVSRVLDTVHFISKSQSQLLPIVDAIAFGLRRYMANESSGEDFAEAILGESFRLDPIPRDPIETFTAIRWKRPNVKIEVFYTVDLSEMFSRKP